MKKKVTKKTTDGDVKKLTRTEHRIYVTLFQDQFEFYKALQEQNGGTISEYIREDARMGQKARRGTITPLATVKGLQQRISSLKADVTSLENLVIETLTVLHSIQGAVRYLFAANNAHLSPQLSEEALMEWEKIKEKSADITAQKVRAVLPSRKAMKPSTDPPMSEIEESEDHDYDD